MEPDQRQSFLQMLAQGPHPESSEPLSFEESQPAPAEVPPAMAALAGETPPPMDLGHDAQLQGTALSLRSISQRLTLIAEGLKLIPALENISRDLQHINYGDAAAALDAVTEWARGEEAALYQELERRRAARSGG